MKRIFALVAFCALLLAGCNDTPDTPKGNITIDDSKRSIVAEGGTDLKRVDFTAQTEWTATLTLKDGKSWCTASPLRGQAGSATILINVKPNDTGAPRIAELLLRAGETEVLITLTQKSLQAIIPVQETYVADVKGGTVDIEVQSNVVFEYAVAKESREWIESTGSTVEPNPSGELKTSTLRFNVDPYTGEGRRIGEITLTHGTISQTVKIAQGEYYASTDFSADGTVVTLQEATEGNGIDVVLMGDAFSDRLIADGTYDRVMDDAMEALFSEEPYKSFRHLFNVYKVTAVSTNEQYFDGMKTVFSSYFVEGTLVGGNDDKCKSYARKVPGMTSSRLNETLIITMMNREYYAGTCYMHRSSSTGDYGLGVSVSYFPLGTDKDMFTYILLHEAGGHGFPKLFDEYAYASNPRIPNEVIQMGRDDRNLYGWGKNVDYTSDETKVQWSKFINDERYADENIGVYEGAETYMKGAYRPTLGSIMNMKPDNVRVTFNAPSREAIYYRIHKLAYGRSWDYDFEEFVKYDAINRGPAAQNAPRLNLPNNLPPLHAPIRVGTPAR